MRRSRLFTGIATMSAIAATVQSGLAWRAGSVVELWYLGTPGRWLVVSVSRRTVKLGEWDRADWHPKFVPAAWRVGPLSWTCQSVSYAKAGREWYKRVADAVARGGRYAHRGNFGWVAGETDEGPSFRGAWVPTALVVWAAITPAMAWAAVRLAGHRRQRRLAAGRCGHCGYDLRATPDRCPECGAAGSRTVDAGPP